MNERLWKQIAESQECLISVLGSDPRSGVARNSPCKDPCLHSKITLISATASTLETLRAVWSGGPPRIDTVISQVSDPHRLSPYQGAAVVRYQCCRLTVVLQPPPTMQQLPRRPSLRSYVSCDSDFDFHSELIVVIYDCEQSPRSI